MFADYNQGAQRAAMMYSFFATCKEHEVNYCDWLREVLVRVGHARPSQIVESQPGA